MAVEAPLVRHFIACEEIDIEAGGKNVSLMRLIYAIVPLAGEEYPLVQERLCLFALLTNGRGIHSIALKMSRFEGGQNVGMVEVPARDVDFGQDPTAVFGLPIPLRNVTFDRPGQYVFHLLCNGVDLAEEKILLR